MGGKIIGVMLGLLAAAHLDAATAADDAPPPKSFSELARQVMERPVYRHAMFGLEVWSLDTGKPLYAVNGDKLFTPGSTTKLFTEGAALTLLGPDYRFHTPLYRTGAGRP